MSTTDVVIHCSLILILLLIMAYLSWRKGSLAVIFTAPFTNGSTEGITITALMFAVLYWVVNGWNTIVMVVIIAFAIVWFILGRLIARYHKRLTS